MAVFEFPNDTEFNKLIERRSDIDVTRAALELARDGQPKLEFQPTLDWIADRADALRPLLAVRHSNRDLLAALRDCLAGELGITGDPEAYQAADSSYLNRVIERRTGIPIALSVLYMAVARAAGLPLRGVSAPGHFITRCETPDGPLFLDAYEGGRILTYDECLERYTASANLTPSELRPALEPASPRAIVLRMLNNLKALFARQERWQQAWLVQRRLSALQPTSLHERRDLAIIAVHAHYSGLAIRLLEGCLQSCPDEERPVLEQHLALARRHIAQWN